MMPAVLRKALACLILAAPAGPALAADLVTLSPQTWDRYAPDGKEADAIHGDFALANDQVVAVVAQPGRWRNANMTVRSVGGCLIDLTRRDRPSDQLSAFYPGAMLRELRFGGVEVDAPEVYETAELASVFVRGRQVRLRMVAAPREAQPDVEVTYILEDGRPDLRVVTTFVNRSEKTLDVELVDAVRADNTFEQGPEGPADLLWLFDLAFGQAYGVAADGHKILGVAGRQRLLRYQDGAGKVAVSLAPGASYRLERRVIPGADLFAVRRAAETLAGQVPKTVAVTVKDRSGKPVAGADVSTLHDGRKLWGRTDAEGKIDVLAGAAGTTLTVADPARGEQKATLGPDAPATLAVELPEAGTVVAKITAADGGPIPCKVQFTGRDGTPTPDFGPESGEHAVKNLYYTADGTFRRDLAPGSYDVIVSYGPEYDAVFTTLEVARGAEARLEAKLVRTVKTDGWISTDYHSHASPSGDNTASQLGRVLNLVCEHIEFAPCTEHNRLDTYDPHLKRLGAAHRMATCVGMELTGRPLPINHQNAFPLALRPHTQDGGGPTTDDDPEVQIERLAMWDAGAEKLVQVNHPDLGWMFRDRDGDGRPDQGYSGMFGRVDVIEIHPPHLIFAEPTVQSNGKTYNNTIRNWLQLLNQGRRIPGVVNTDAHYNFHGSGWLRNYVKSPTDDPARVATLDVVRESEKGHLVMSNGPFLEVSLAAGENGSAAAAGPGDDLAAPGGRATLSVRVQCPNWFDVDRVQVFVNGKPEPSLNFTRAGAGDRFSSGPVKFDQTIPLRLEADAHVIVAAIGEQSKLGPVMGPEHGEDQPVAVTNPIFVDVDGSGFKSSGDELGALPVKGGR